MGIGIMWGARADCDLYVKADAKARELYYGYTKSKEGRYFHDYVDSNLGVDYEYCELKAPVNLNQVEAYVNYYAGRTSPVRGIVVVFYEGNSFYGEFVLTAPKGNRGSERDHRQRSQYWTRLDLVGLVTTRNSAQPAIQSR